MLIFSDSFKESNLTYNREQITVVKITLPLTIKRPRITLYFTSAQISINDPDGVVFQGVIKSSGTTPQRIQPEKGFSEIGTSTGVFSDLGITEKIRELDVLYNTTLYNKKYEVFIGYQGMLFDDFAPMPPLYVDDVNNDELNYTIVAGDTQRKTKKSICDNKPVALILTGIGTGGTDQSPVTLEVDSTSRFELVDHDSNWQNAPLTTSGYLKYFGITDSGQDAVEYLRYNSKTATTFNIVERGVFGTRTLNIKGSTQNESHEVTECIYIDLPVPKMVLALLTGELYGQPGKRLPDHWHAGVPVSEVSINSIESVGDDLWATPLEFVDLDKQGAKNFIAKQCLSVMNLFMLINQQGELSLKRFGSQSQVGAGGGSLTNENIVSPPSIKRSSKTIKNNFLIKWEYRPEDKTYKRTSFYGDAESIERVEYASDANVISLLGIRNRNRYSGLAVANLARSIRARYSDPSIKITVSVLMRDAIEYEVGDTVQLQLSNQPDASSEDTLDGSYEIQSVTINHLTGEMSLDLYSTSGRAGDLELDEGEDAVTINRSGMTELVNGPLGVVSGSEFIVANGANFASGQYWFSGDIVFDGSGFTDVNVPAHTCYINQDVVFECRDFDMRGNARIDGVGRGVVGAQGGYGGGDVSDLGFRQRRKTVALFFTDHYYKTMARDSVDGPGVPAVDPVFDSLRPFIDDSNYIKGIPAKLYGNGSAKGGRLHLEITEDSYSSAPGGAAVAGGAGLCIVCENMYYDEDCKIDTSGANGKAGSTQSFSGAGTFHAGRSGFGWPGIVICYMKTRGNPLPFLNDVHVAKCGSRASAGFKITVPLGQNHYKTESGENYGPPSGPSISGKVFEPLAFLAAADLVTKGFQVNKSLYIQKSTTKAPTVGVDSSGSAKAATITITELRDTPSSPKGNKSTLEILATKVSGDNDFDYAIFEWKLPAQKQWLPITYDVSTKATITVPSDGETYEFRAISVNHLGRHGGVSYATKKVGLVTASTDPNESDGGGPTAPIELKVPDVTGLALTNNTGVANNFKSGNAEFAWNKSANNFAGSGIAVVDLYFAYYLVEISNVSGVVRTEQTTDNFYTYTLDKNRKDSAGRTFTISVRAVGNTGHISDNAATLSVTNPAPSAPSGVTFQGDFQGIDCNFTLPTGDVDFVGVDVYWQAGTPADVYATGQSKTLTGNNFRISGLSTNTTYTVGLKSVDLFGDGNQITQTSVSTPDVPSAPLTEITNPVTIDNANGRIVTDNVGYQVWMGAVYRPTVSPNTLMIHSWNGVNSPFWVDTQGNAGFSGNVQVGAGSNVEAGATVGADWDTNVSNKPTGLAKESNLIDPSSAWVVGTSGAQFGSEITYNVNGNPAESRVENVSGPFLSDEPVWQCIPDSANDGDGGWNTTQFNINPDKTHHYGVYVRMTSNPVTGSFYFGCGVNYVEDLGGAVNGNPYFRYGQLPSNKWCLVIGTVHPEGYTGSPSNISGVYDVETGEKLNYTMTDFRQRMGYGTNLHRCYHFYNAVGDDATVFQEMARPFVVTSDKMPPIENLTSKLKTIAPNADNTVVAVEAGTEISNGGIWLKGASASIEVGASKAWGTKGIQLQYNSGDPRVFIGDPAGGHLVYDVDGLKITDASVETSNSGMRTVLGGDGGENLVTYSTNGSEVLNIGWSQIATPDSTIFNLNTKNAKDSGDSFPSSMYTAVVSSYTPSTVDKNVGLSVRSDGGSEPLAIFGEATDSDASGIDPQITGVKGWARMYYKTTNVPMRGVEGYAEHKSTGANAWAYGGYFRARKGKYAIGIYADAAEGSTVSYAAYFAGDVYCTGDFVNGSSRLSLGGWNRLTTPSGYIEFGPANSSYGHIYTDRPYFYFNKPLYILGHQVANSSVTALGAIRVLAYVGGIYNPQRYRYEGDSVPGSELRTSNFNGGFSGGGLSGTWKLLNWRVDKDTPSTRAGLFMRIA